MNQSSEKTTHFGYKDVPVEQKASMVREVFDSVAENYDLMNDLMSMGVHRLWKRYFLSIAGIRPGFQILDLAGGTGDIAALMSPKVGPDGQIILADINDQMLKVGRHRMIDRGLIDNIKIAQVNAESLPFEEGCFDRVTMAFGLRNVTDQSKALESIRKTLKPGGKAMILEFSQVENPAFSKFYDFYSFSVLPKLGDVIANDADSYQYLAESIRKHPPQQKLQQMMLDAGFDDAKYQNLTNGIVAIHTGYVY
ncbi:MAG: bifunctional demethylmenaquinone methyltransferase/2-methoxy-6-polyprenyl-1,4-benzoquinol methylase UbiE [bacterium]